MNCLDDQPDEPFPENLCFSILTLNFKYLRWINKHDMNWNNICPNKQLNFIKQLDKYYNDEWIKHYIDTDDMDDY